MRLDVTAQLVAVNELLLADGALEFLHAEVDGSSVGGQAVLAVESLPAVVAHEAGAVLVLHHMALRGHKQHIYFGLL